MMTRAFKWCFILLLAGTGVIRAAVTPIYRVAAGDELAISVVGNSDVAADVVISPDGTIQLPLIGSVAVQDLTLQDITQKLTTIYSKRLVKPEMIVRLVKPRDVLVYALGAVKNPNAYTLKPEQRATELLSEAGGLSVSIGDCSATLLRAATRENIPIDLRAACAGDSKANLIIEPGDVLTVVPSITIPVYVSGVVKNPGLLSLPENATVSKAIAVAGGLVLQPDEVRLSLVRGQERIPVDLDSSMQLRQGDEVRVESRMSQIFVNGEVRNPNQYQLREGFGLCEAMSMAGGITENALQSGVTITHADGKIDTVDLVDLSAKGGNVILHANDRVDVPRSTFKVIVLGGVNAPGAFPFDDKHPMTAIEAISRAAGIARLGQPNKVLVLRTVGGKTQKIKINVQDALSKGQRDRDITLQANDVVYVPNGKIDVNLVVDSLSTLGVWRTAIMSL